MLTVAVAVADCGNIALSQICLAIYLVSYLAGYIWLDSL